jgi:hypothetical protein
MDGGKTPISQNSSASRQMKQSIGLKPKAIRPTPKAKASSPSKEGGNGLIPPHGVFNSGLS